MRKYRISKDLKPYIRRILLRSFYQCHIEAHKDTLWCHTNASSDTFHRIVQRAKCEKASSETGIFYVTTKEANNSLLLPVLLDQARTSVYRVIDDRQGERGIH